VLVVDETGDEKSSTDCVGAARQYSGALGGIGLCQVAVHLTYATARGHAPIDRALYLVADWAADEERRLLTGVPDDIEFVTKPQLAAAMLQRVRDLGIPARWLAGDEVYGGLELRRTARTLGFDYVLAVRADHRVDTAVGRLTVTELAARVPKRNWMRMRTGHGLKGDRHYDWAMLDGSVADLVIWVVQRARRTRLRRRSRFRAPAKSRTVRFGMCTTWSHRPVLPGWWRRLIIRRCDPKCRRSSPTALCPTGMPARRRSTVAATNSRRFPDQ